MVKTRLSSQVPVPNYHEEPISDDDLARGFLLDLGASGRSEKTIFIYGDSVKRLSAFGHELGFPPLALMDKDHVRHWLTSLHQKGSPHRYASDTGASTGFSSGVSKRESAKITLLTTSTLPGFPR